MRSQPSRFSQTGLPGCEARQDLALQRKADQPLKPKTAQAPCDLGLFGDAHTQTEMEL